MELGVCIRALGVASVAVASNIVVAAVTKQCVRAGKTSDHVAICTPVHYVVAISTFDIVISRTCINHISLGGRQQRYAMLLGGQPSPRP